MPGTSGYHKFEIRRNACLLVVQQHLAAAYSQCMRHEQFDI